MDNSQKPQSRVQPSPEGGQPSEPLYDLLDFLRANWKDLLIGVALGIAVLLAIFAWKTRADRKRDQALIQFAVASTTAQFEEILEQFPRSRAAELSMLLAARGKFDQGRYEEADRLYASFLQKYPGHFLEPVARLGRAHCREATGLLEEALADFRDLSASLSNATAFWITARLGEARCLRQLGLFNDALAVYDDLLLSHSESGWSPIIEDLKETTERESRKMTVAPPSPPAPTAE